MADSVAIHGFSKDDTKGWTLEMKSLVKGLFPLVFTENWAIIVGSAAFANRIVDGFSKIHTSQIKDLASHIDFLTQEPVVFQAWDYLMKTVEDDKWNTGDEVLGDEEKDGPGEQLVLAVLCKVAVIHYVWENVQAGIPDGDVTSISTLTNLLMKARKLETRAVTVKQLAKIDKIDKQLDPLTAMMEGRGICYADKVLVNTKKPSTASAVSDEAQKLQELQRERDRYRQEAEDNRRRAEDADAARRREIERRAEERRENHGRGGGGDGRGGRGRGGGGGGRGGGAQRELPSFRFTNETDICVKAEGGCGGVGHKKDRCCGKQGTVICDRCKGEGHRSQFCPSPFTQL